MQFRGMEYEEEANYNPAFSAWATIFPRSTTHWSGARRFASSKDKIIIASPSAAPSDALHRVCRHREKTADETEFCAQTRTSLAQAHLNKLLLDRAALPGAAHTVVSGHRGRGRVPEPTLPTTTTTGPTT